MLVDTGIYSLNYNRINNNDSMRHLTFKAVTAACYQSLVSFLRVMISHPPLI